MGQGKIEGLDDLQRPPNDLPLSSAAGGYNSPYPFEILHTPQRVTLITEYFHEVRRVYLDGRQHPRGNPDPSAMGHSIGRWEGATLVVDTGNFKESPAFRVPWSDQFQMVERIRRIRDGNVLEIDVTIEDPVAFTEPLHGTFYFKKEPALEWSEWNCDGFFDYQPFAPEDPRYARRWNRRASPKRATSSGCLRFRWREPWVCRMTRSTGGSRVRKDAGCRDEVH